MVTEFSIVINEYNKLSKIINLFLFLLYNSSKYLKMLFENIYNVVHYSHSKSKIIIMGYFQLDCRISIWTETAHKCSYSLLILFQYTFIIIKFLREFCAKAIKLHPWGWRCNSWVIYIRKNVVYNTKRCVV